MRHAYVKRLEETKAAFDKLPGGGPFQPDNEALGWVFHRSHIETVLHRLGADDEYIVILFGVGPKEERAMAKQGTESTDVVRCIMTPARRTEVANVYQFTRLAPSVTADDEFGAEQGNTCCHGLNAFDCAEQLFNTGTFQMFL